MQIDLLHNKLPLCGHATTNLVRLHFTSTAKNALSLLLVGVLAACGSETKSPSVNNPTPTTPSQTSGSANSGCNDKSWFAGVTELCAGKLVYRDYVYDDYGADAGAISPAPSLLNLSGRFGDNGNPFANTPGLLSPTAGDSRYPVGLESTADLVKLVLSRDGSNVKAEFEMNALYQANQTIAAVAVDSDNNPETGSVKLLGLTTKGADVVYEFKVGNPETNIISGTFPMPSSAQWRVWAVTAQSNGTVMNVAFRGPDEEAAATGGIPDQILPNKGNWWEDKQAAALSAGDISSFVAKVTGADLGSNKSSPAVVNSGYHQRVYTSAYTVPNSTGEGMTLTGILGREKLDSTACGQYFHFVGKYQPYGIYIPKSGSANSGARSLQVILHGCEANHASQTNQPNMQKQFGDDLNRILVSPLGRGPYGFYSDLSERDVLDVLEDTIATLNVDLDRVLVGGYSMGGFGSTRLAALYPDRFAGLSNWVGFTGSVLNTPLPGNPLVAGEQALQGITGDALPLRSRIGGDINISNYLGNLRHVPSTHSYGALDELVQVTTGLDWGQKLGAAQDVIYEFYMHLAAEHLTFMALDEWSKEAAFTKDLKLVKNPSRITYTTNEKMAFPEYGIRHNKAYWLSDIVGRNPGDIALDAESLACSANKLGTTTGQTAGNGPVPFVQLFRRLTGMTNAGTAEQKLTATFRNLKSVTLDLAGSCLQTGAAYTITTDGPLALKLSNGKVLSLPAGTSAGNL